MGCPESDLGTSQQCRGWGVELRVPEQFAQTGALYTAMNFLGGKPDPAVVRELLDLPE
jgi:hypothetical protein